MFKNADQKAGASHITIPRETRFTCAFSIEAVAREAGSNLHTEHGWEMSTEWIHLLIPS